MVAAANPDDRHARFRQRRDFVRESVSFQIEQILRRIFRAGQQNEIRRPQVIALLHETKIHIRLVHQRIEIREIGNLRRLQDRDVQIAHDVILRHVLQGNGILVIDAELVQIRNDAQDRDARFFFQKIQRRREQRDVAAEFIDDNAADERAFVFIQEHQRPDDGRQRPAAIDIGNQENRRAERLGDAHIHDVILFQIDFRRTPRPFDDKDVKMFFHVIERLDDRGPRLLAVALLIIFGAVISDRFSEQNDLRAGISRRFQKHRIHFDAGQGPGRLRLRHRRAAHLAAVLRHIGIERHILRFEWRDAFPVLLQNPAKSRRQNAFPHMRTCPLKHRIFRHDSATSLFFKSIVIPATDRYTASARAAMY